MRSAPTLTLAVASALAEAQTACGSGNPTAASGFAVTPFATGFVARSFSASALVGARLRVAPRRGAKAAPLRVEAIPTTTEAACNQRSGGF